MKLLLGTLMVLMVSGEDMETVEAFLGRDICLPCTCLDRNLSNEFKWQVQKQNESQLIYKQINKLASKYGESYEGRVQTFLDQNISDCSILLKNVTAEDQGTYKCIFYQGDQYNNPAMNLRVYSHRSVLQYAPLILGKGDKVFRCDVKGGDSETMIQWRQAGQVVESSPLIEISTTRTQHAPTGLFNLKSELKTKLSWTPEPECEAIPHPAVTEPYKSDIVRTHTYTLLPLLFVVVVGSVLILHYRWKNTEVSARTSEG
ncbi:butyrophilin subfamily 2 member A2 isoform X2 [Parambassis ranga]|uniref:Butyrophilin subfamily 2 member A2 isoform X2 n=1 Tax=Parambassis ranga TaxID=210632 RepID=A0A6P7H7Z7_9TELE|nr:butyrophilin subfamily 2 member A2-like isoform X2 [Parambassis ranga]